MSRVRSRRCRRRRGAWRRPDFRGQLSRQRQEVLEQHVAGGLGRVVGGDRGQDRREDGTSTLPRGLQGDVAREAISDDDVHGRGHQVATLDVADEVQSFEGRQELMGLFHQGRALRRLLADREQTDARAIDVVVAWTNVLAIRANWTSISGVHSEFAPASTSTMGV